MLEPSVKQYQFVVELFQKKIVLVVLRQKSVLLVVLQQNICFFSDEGVSIGYGAGDRTGNGAGDRDDNGAGDRAGNGAGDRAVNGSVGLAGDSDAGNSEGDGSSFNGCDNEGFVIKKSKLQLFRLAPGWELLNFLRASNSISDSVSSNWDLFFSFFCASV